MNYNRTSFLFLSIIQWSKSTNNSDSIIHVRHVKKQRIFILKLEQLQKNYVPIEVVQVDMTIQ